MGEEEENNDEENNGENNEENSNEENNEEEEEGEEEPEDEQEEEEEEGEEEPEECQNQSQPYSAEACRQAAQHAGLTLGHAKFPFTGPYGTKGCYTYNSGKYKGHAFYGTGGSETDRKVPARPPKVRVQGHDKCGGGTSEVI